MSILKCRCGNIIRDQSNNNPYKAHYIVDKKFEGYYEKIESEIAKYIESIEEKSERRWIKNRFGENYPQNISRESILDDIITGHRLKNEEYIYQCVECKRIFIEVEGKLIAYYPENEKDEIFNRG